jgi:hypothetical protein
VLTYVEPGRVTAVEGVLQATKELRSGHRIGFKLVYDALTGASANGATPADRIQTFTSPSGKGSYHVDPRETPLDTTFRDQRYAFTGSWSFPVDRVSTGTVSGNLSTETDYFSAGLSTNLRRDFFLRNTTLSGGLSVSVDRVTPQGGVPLPLGRMGGPSDENEDPESSDDGNTGFDDDDEREGGSGASESKTLVEGLLGISQVLDRRTVAQVSYSAGRVSGYQNDPYKILSVVAAGDSPEAGEPLAYLYENRPRERTKQSVFGEVRRRLGAHVADLSYRYFWDDWSVHSHTVELRYDHRIGERSDVAPHLRLYRQTAAEFYHRFLVDGAATPALASADYRVGSFEAMTLGLDFAHTLRNGHRWHLGAEYYLQQGDSSPPGAFGSLRELDLFPKVDAVMLRVGYSARLGF